MFLKRVLGFLKRQTVAFLSPLVRGISLQFWVPLSVGAFLHRALETPAQALVRGRRIRIFVSSRVELNRVRTYSKKEPETLDWVDGFEPGSILYDIGANIGVYSLYAAARRVSGMKIFAFEPESLNYASLNRNIALNGFHETVRAFCLALCNETGFSALTISKFQAGGSLNQFGGEEGGSKHVQGSFGLTLNDLCSRWAFPQPHYIKVDVDGLELPIIQGASGVLSHPDFRGLLIEMPKDDPEQRREIQSLCEAAGLSLRYQSADSTRYPNFIFEKKAQSPVSTEKDSLSSTKS